MTVTQNTTRGVVNWQSFSIASGHSVQFENGSGATLNQVTGAQMSELQGHLGATGSLYLINPNGVVIGPKGSVATGGSFVASTRDASDSAFMQGKSLTLSGTSSGTVKNEGRITSTNGNVVLVGQSVSNSGTVSAANGTVALAAGNRVILSEAEGPDGIYVETDATAKGDVTNTGHIQAAAARLAAAGGNVYALAGNRDGLIQATGTSSVNGQVWLTAPHGIVTVEDTTVTARTQDGAGGTIRANGREVSLGSRAVLDASATQSGRKGGQVLVGTDAMGGVNLARRTTIASGAALKARGKDNGAGGEIETSAHTMDLGNATIDAGVGGQWLLDPDDLTIDANAADTISSTLNSGTDVTQETTATTATGAGTSAAGNGDIILNAPISWSSGSTLSLSAYRNITLNSGITVSGTGKLTITTNNANNTGSSTTINYNNGSAIRFDNVSMESSSASSPLNINGKSYTLISNLTELQSLTNSGLYALVQSLNASGISNFTPISVSSSVTSLIFDGLGNTISNLTISSNSTQVGLFSSIYRGTIKNIGVINGNVTGTGSADSRSVGGIVGVINSNTASISNSYFIGNVTDTGSGTRGNIGGLVGYANGSINNSFSSGTVTVNGSSTSSRSGGLVGINYVGIESSYSNSNVSNSNSSGTVGGLVGFNYSGTVNNSYSSGNVTGASGYIGGLIGQSFQNSRVTNVYAAGEVTSTTGSNYLGGLIGTNSASVSNGYWNTDNVASGIGSGNNSGAVGLTTKEWLTNGPLVSGSGNSFSDSSAWVNGSLYPVLANLPYIRVMATLSQTYGSSDIAVSNIRYIDQSGNDASSKVSGSVSWHSPVLSSSSNAGSTGLIYGTGILAPGYQILYNSSNTINPATLSITASNQNGTYGQTPALDDAAFTTSGLVNGDTVSAVTLATDATSRSAVGSYGITASNAQGSGLSNYTIGYTSGSYVINPATLSITASNQNGTYGQTPALGDVAFTTSGLVNGDTVSAVTLATDATSRSAVGSYGITASNAQGSGLSNYTIGYTPGSYVINPATLSITASNQNGTYGQTPALDDAAFTTSGLVNGDTVSAVTLATDATSRSAVGSYGITASNAQGSGLSNYTIGYTPGSYVINPATLSITASNQNGTYGQTPALDDAAFTTSGLVNGDTVSAVTLATDATSRSAVGSYGITASNAQGSGLSNYTIGYTPGSYVINPATLSITASNQNGTYGQTPALDDAAFTTSGLVNGDTVSAVTLATDATSRSAVGSYGITASNAQGSGLSNYTIGYTPGSYVINPATLSITASNQNGTYGQTPALGDAAFTTSGLVNGDTVSAVTLATDATSRSAVGSYGITASNAQGSGLSNYTIGYTPGSYVINPATLSITASNQNGTYGQTPALDDAAFTTSGLVNGDTVSAVTLATDATSRSAVGSYGITASNAQGSGLSNYTIGYTPGSYVINPATLSITASNQNGTYGQTPALGDAAFTTSGLVNGDTVSAVTLATDATSRSAVGSYGITASNAQGSGLSNYTIGYTPGSYVINPATLSITASNQNGTYGQTPALDDAAFTTSGLVNGDTVSAVTLATDATSRSAVGSYGITASNAQGSGLSNYTIGYTPGSYVINPATLSITASNQNGTYGQTPALDDAAFTTSGLVNGDTVSAVTLATDATSRSAVGSYGITASNAQGSGLSNYTIGYTPGSYVINPATLSITASNQNGTYGQTPALGDAAFTTSGLVNGDTVSAVTLATDATSRSAVGSYGITASNAQGSGLSNYTIGYTPGSYVINPATLSITASNQNGTYGQTPALDDAAFTTSGLVNGDTVSAVTLATDATSRSAVGSYGITASNAQGSGLSNYTIGYTPGSYVINPATLSITASNQNGTYGQTPALDDAAFTTSGLVNGDTVSAVTLATDATSRSAVGSYGITASNAQGSGLSNYTIGYTPGSYVINPATLSITASNQNGTYGQTPALDDAAFTTSGLVNGDTVSAVTLATDATSRSAVGSYGITASNAQGSGLSNYTIGYTPGSYVINPATLSITASNQNGTYGQTPALDDAAFTTSGLVNGDTVSAVTLATDATSRSAVGSYGITASNAQGSGLSNYTIGYTPGSYVINPATLSITASNQNGTYGQTPALDDAAFTTSGLVNGDTVSAVTLATDATSRSAVGSYGITASNAQGSGLSNYTIGYTPGSYVINPATLSITASNQNGTYGQTPALDDAAFTTSGLVNGDTVSAVTLATDATSRSAVGSYGITASNAQGSGLSNYTIGYTPGSYVINPATLSITASNQNGTYGQTPALDDAAFTTSGLVNGDTVSAVTLATDATSRSAVGSYGITASNAQGSGLSNYTIGYTPGSYVINPATLSITASNQNGTYGQTPALDDAAFTTSGLVNGDTVSAVTLATDATSRSAVGSYGITASNAQGSGLSNYTIGYTPGSYVINPATLSITASNQNGTYGQTPALGDAAFTTSGLVNGDTVSAVTLATDATSRSAVGSYGITASNAQGSGLSNYTIGYTPGSYVINPATLSITASNQNGTYGQTPALGDVAFTTSGLVNGDTVSAVTLATDATSRSAVGSYGITASNAQGSGLSNYTIGYTPAILKISLPTEPEPIAPGAAASASILWPTPITTPSNVSFLQTVMLLPSSTPFASQTSIIFGANQRATLTVKKTPLITVHPMNVSDTSANYRVLSLLPSVSNQLQKAQ
ncbi:hypothetical protein JCM15831A_29010 [Asaia astilbis]